ncbi:hypothetical protein GEMRC1_013679 [Eukaryota sp. GEM-RC1]
MSLLVFQHISSTTSITYYKQHNHASLSDVVKALAVYDGLNIRRTLNYRFAKKLLTSGMVSVETARKALDYKDIRTNDEAIERMVKDLPVYVVHHSNNTSVSRSVVMPLNSTELLTSFDMLYRKKKLLEVEGRPGKKREPYSCSYCKERGHTKAKCPLNPNSKSRKRLASTSLPDQNPKHTDNN